jgi:hypothetical protein
VVVVEVVERDAQPDAAHRVGHRLGDGHGPFPNQGNAPDTRTQPFDVEDTDGQVIKTQGRGFVLMYQRESSFYFGFGGQCLRGVQQPLKVAAVGRS